MAANLHAVKANHKSNKFVKLDCKGPLGLDELLLICPSLEYLQTMIAVEMLWDNVQ